MSVLNRILLGVIGILVGAVATLGVLLDRSIGKIEFIKNTPKDTVLISHIDTIEIEKPVVSYEYITDTVVVTVNEGRDTVQLPRSTRYYKSDLYEIWVSGYEPTLDKVNIFKQTDTRYIYRDVVKEVYRDKYSLHLLGSAYMYGKSISGGSADLVLVTPKGFSFGGGGGYMKGVGGFGKITLGYRIL